MLHAFIVAARAEIIERTRVQLRGRSWPSASASELASGVPLFLDQLVQTLRLESTKAPFAGNIIGDSAA